MPGENAKFGDTSFIKSSRDRQGRGKEGEE